MAASSIPSTPSYLELIEFALKGKTPQEVLFFRPTMQQIDRISDLRELEHLIIMMKKQAAKQMAG
jgi:hypothetical protein